MVMMMMMMVAVVIRDKSREVDVRMVLCISCSSIDAPSNHRKVSVQLGGSIWKAWLWSLELQTGILRGDIYDFFGLEPRAV